MEKVMIKIGKIEINEKVLKLYFRYIGETDRFIKIYARDSIFNTVNVWHKMEVSAGGNYWATFNFSSLLGDYLNCGINFLFLNANEGEKDDIIWEENIPFIITDLEKRTHKGKYLHSDKNFWIIGDSNIGYLFKNEEKIYTNGYVVNEVTHLLLSLNRFLNSDYLGFLKSLPIRDGDIISIQLGEIDLRASVLKKSKKQSVNPKTLLDNILENYIITLHSIKKQYPKCEIIVLGVNPPIKDGVIEDNELISGKETERQYLYLHFNNFFTNQIEFKYWDCFGDYIENGFLKDDFVISSKDQHINNPVYFLDSLKSKINLL